MNNTIKKYIEFIESILEELVNDSAFKGTAQHYGVISNESLGKLNVWCFYSSLKECLISGDKDSNKRVITYQLDFVAEDLLSSPLNPRERTDIILYLMERNITIGYILDSDKKRRLIKHEKFYEYGITPKMVDELFNNGTVEDLFYTDDTLLDKESLEMKNIMKECIVILDKNNSFIKNHQKIKTHFLDKKNKYDETDIEEVYNALLGLEIDDRLCNTMKFVLKKRLEKRKKQEARGIVSKKKIATSNEETQNTEISKKKTKYLSEKEYKRIKKESLTYFDSYKGIPTRELSIDEILYCASLLFKIGEEDSIVRALYDRSSYNKKLLESAEENPIATYLMVYDKLKFYEEKLEIEDEITLLDNYFQETFLSGSEDYSVWKQAISEELIDLLEKIPVGYKYEIETKPQYDKGTTKVKVRNTKK